MEVIHDHWAEKSVHRVSVAVNDKVTLGQRGQEA